MIDLLGSKYLHGEKGPVPVYLVAFHCQIISVDHTLLRLLDDDLLQLLHIGARLQYHRVRRREMAVDRLQHPERLFVLWQGVAEGVDGREHSQSAGGGGAGGELDPLSQNQLAKEEVVANMLHSMRIPRSAV